MKFYRATPLNTIPAGHNAEGEAGEAGGRRAGGRGPAGGPGLSGRPGSREGRPHGAGGGRPIRAGEQLVFLKVIAAARRWYDATARSRPAGTRLIMPGWAPWNGSSMTWPVPG